MKRTFLTLLAGVLTFTAAAQTSVFSEDFQTGIPATWTLIKNDNHTPAMAVQEYDSAAWISKMDPDDSSNFTASSTSYFSPAGQANRWLISPAITLGAFGNALTFDAKSHDPSFPDDYMVLVSKTGTNLADFTDTLSYIQQEYATVTNRTIDLSDKGLDGETIHLAFVILTDDGFKLYIDNIEVTKDDPASIHEADDLAIEWATLENGLYQVSTQYPLESMHVYATTGQEVAISTQSKLDIRTLPTGIYMVRIVTKAGVKTIQVQKF